MSGEELVGLLPHMRCVTVDLRQVAPHGEAERRQSALPAAANEQRAAELVFQELDRARQRRLRHAATARRAREIAFRADREEVADLIHFHDGWARASVLLAQP